MAGIVGSHIIGANAIFGDKPTTDRLFTLAISARLLKEYYMGLNLGMRQLPRRASLD